MTDSFRRSSKSDAESQQLQMEQGIDHLGGLARSGVEASEFIRQVLCSAIDPGGASRAILWRRSAESQWEVAGEAPGSEVLGPDEIEQQQELLNKAVQDLRATVVKSSECEDWYAPISVTGQTQAVLQATIPTGCTGASLTISQFLTALAEITADFLSQRELRQLRQAQAAWLQWDQYQLRLGQSDELALVSSTIVNDGLLLVGCDRIGVLVRHGPWYILKSISGVDRVEPRSTATRSIEALALTTARDGQPVWSDLKGESAGHVSHHAVLMQYLRENGASAVGLVPILDRSPVRESSLPVAVLIFERFQDVVDNDNWQSRAELLATRSQSALQTAIEREEIPWLSVWQILRRWPSRLRSPAAILVLGLLLGMIAALYFIPAELTVSGPATLWPAQRREIFASTSGIVDQILVEHGDSVKADQPLIVLRDPELEAETPRIVGEIATVAERLKGVQSARLTGSNTPDAASRSRQLTVDEEELKERLRTLEQQRLLLEERQASLTLRSPIAGQVLTWNLAQQLSARPVERGQSLLTIGDTAGPWIVEVDVPDKDIGPLLNAQQTLKPDLDVDFLLAADPGRTYHGRVESRSVTAQPDDVSRSRVHVVVGFDRTQMDHPRPGATALPRIHCGSRALGYVWLRDLIDAIRTRLFF